MNKSTKNRYKFNILSKHPENKTLWLEDKKSMDLPYKTRYEIDSMVGNKIYVQYLYTNSYKTNLIKKQLAVFELNTLNNKLEMISTSKLISK